MTLENALEALVPRDKPQGCKTCKWLSTQTPKVQEFVHTWVSEGHSRKQLFDTLSAHGYPLSISGLQCHYDHVRRDEP